MFPTGETYSSGDYKTLMNLVSIELLKEQDIPFQITHVEEVPETMMMKNAVISVFFLRFLQHGKYFKRHVPEKKKVWSSYCETISNLLTRVIEVSIPLSNLSSAFSTTSYPSNASIQSRYFSPPPSPVCLS